MSRVARLGGNREKANALKLTHHLQILAVDNVPFLFYFSAMQQLPFPFGQAAELCAVRDRLRVLSAICMQRIEETVEALVGHFA
ncbi:MAG TPA: hypothetical protein VMF67_13785 [Rhizomicrobium sp.]|nr:hypothetical protein [Rhizomicrobium sp.]